MFYSLWTKWIILSFRCKEPIQIWLIRSWTTNEPAATVSGRETCLRTRWSCSPKGLDLFGINVRNKNEIDHSIIRLLVVTESRRLDHTQINFNIRLTLLFILSAFFNSKSRPSDIKLFYNFDLDRSVIWNWFIFSKTNLSVTTFVDQYESAALSRLPKYSFLTL